MEFCVYSFYRCKPSVSPPSKNPVRLLDFLLRSILVDSYELVVVCAHSVKLVGNKRFLLDCGGRGGSSNSYLVPHVTPFHTVITASARKLDAQCFLHSKLLYPIYLSLPGRYVKLNVSKVDYCCTFKKRRNEVYFTPKLRWVDLATAETLLSQVVQRKLTEYPIPLGQIP